MILLHNIGLDIRDLNAAVLINNVVNLSTTVFCFHDVDDDSQSADQTNRELWRNV